MSVTLEEMAGRHGGSINISLGITGEAADRGKRLSGEEHARCLRLLEEARHAGKNLEHWGDHDRVRWADYGMACRALERVAPEVEPARTESIFPEIPGAKKSLLMRLGFVLFQKNCRLMTREFDFEPDRETRLARMIVEHGLREVKSSIHEAGHAIVVDGFGAEVDSMEFAPSDETAAIVRYCDFQHFGDHEKIAVPLAGRAAEHEAARHCPALRDLVEKSDGSHSDFAAAAEISAKVKRADGEEAAEELRTKAWEAATGTVRMGFDRILDCAEKFLDESYLTGDEIRDALGDSD